MIVFFRFRHVWTRSNPDIWQTINRTVAEDADIEAIKEGIFEEFQEERGHWDGYQGIDIERIENPQWDVVIEEIDRCTRIINNMQTKLDALHAMLPAPKEDSCLSKQT